MIVKIYFLSTDKILKHKSLKLIYETVPSRCPIMSVFAHATLHIYQNTLNWVTCNFQESPLEIYGSSVMISFEIKTCSSLRTLIAPRWFIYTSELRQKADFDHFDIKRKWKIKKRALANLNMIFSHFVFVYSSITGRERSLFLCLFSTF